MWSRLKSILKIRLLDFYASVYTKSHYRNWGSLSVHDEIIHYVKKTNPDTVLDVGCGTGILTKFICNESRTLIGIDISQKMIDQARNHCQGCPNLEFVNIDIIDYRTDLFFELIICASALQFMEKPEFALRKLTQILRSSGKILISLPHRKSLSNLIAEATKCNNLSCFITRIIILIGWIFKGFEFWSEEFLKKKLFRIGFDCKTLKQTSWGYLIIASRKNKS